MKGLLNFALFVVLVYVGLCAALFFMQRSMIYFPQPRAPGDTSATSPLSVDGAELVVSVRPHGGPNAIVYFGGNGEDVTFNLPAFSAAFPDHALLPRHGAVIRPRSDEKNAEHDGPERAEQSEEIHR